MTLPDSFAPTHGWTLSWVLPLCAIGIIAAYVVLGRAAAVRRWPERTRVTMQRALLAALGLAAVASVATYHDFGLFRYGTFLNEWDVYHYYLGSKYAPELRYYDLYDATLVADAESGLRYDNPSGHIRDLRTSGFAPVETVLANADQVRSRFSEPRWRAFVTDVRWFREQLPVDRWSLLLADKGYNGTPAWSAAVGGLLTRHLDIARVGPRTLLMALDPLLVLLTLAMVAWAFDVRAMLLMVVLVGTHYLLSWGHMKGALLRTDFAMCTTMAVCLVKKDRYGLAGGLLGWAVLSRLFPVLFLVGPMVRFVALTAERRRLEPRLLRLLLSTGATVALGAAVSAVYFGDASIWVEWFGKITQHHTDPSIWQVGYDAIVQAQVVDGVPEYVHIATRLAEEPDLLLAHRLTVGVTLACLLLPTAYFTRFARDWEAITLGFVFVFFLATPTYYYYLLLTVPLLFFAGDLERPARAVGLALMYLVGIAGYLLFAGWEPLSGSVAMLRGYKQEFQTYYYMSWLIGAHACYMAGLAALEARAAMAAKAPPSDPRVARGPFAQ